MSADGYVREEQPNESLDRVPIFKEEDGGKALVGYVILVPEEIPADVVPDLALTPVVIAKPADGKQGFEVREWKLSPRTSIDTRPRANKAPFQHIDPE